jgi:hypothetical protein
MLGAGIWRFYVCYKRKWKRPIDEEYDPESPDEYKGFRNRPNLIIYHLRSVYLKALPQWMPTKPHSQPRINMVVYFFFSSVLWYHTTPYNTIYNHTLWYVTYPYHIRRF